MALIEDFNEKARQIINDGNTENEHSSENDYTQLDDDIEYKIEHIQETDNTHLKIEEDDNIEIIHLDGTYEVGMISDVPPFEGDILIDNNTDGLICWEDYLFHNEDENSEETYISEVLHVEDTQTNETGYSSNERTDEDLDFLKDDIIIG